MWVTWHNLCTDVVVKNLYGIHASKFLKSDFSIFVGNIDKQTFVSP
jgi:hypothetical protein